MVSFCYFWSGVVWTILVVVAGGKNAAVIPNWKVDPRCPNASNPFHVCAQYCFDHLSETAQTSATQSGVCLCFSFLFNSPWNCMCCTHGYPTCQQWCKGQRVDSLWRLISYIYALWFICLFPDKRRGKDVSKDEQRGEINPDCVNASNPYHKCGDHCKRKGW